MSEITSLIKVEEFTSIMQNAPATLDRNQKSVEGSNNFGQSLLDTIEACGGLNDELDAKVASYLDKIKVTAKSMEDRRKPLTQLFDQVRKTFTTLESAISLKDINTIPGKLTVMRNQYAAKKVEEDRKRKEAETRRQNIENEKATYKASIDFALNQHLTAFFNNKSDALIQVWNSLNYANFNDKSRTIKEWPVTYPVEHFKMFRDTVSTFYLDPLTKSTIMTEAMTGKYESFAKQYKFDMEDLISSYVDRLPSRLKEINEQEQLKRTNAEAAAKQEAERLQREEEERKQRAFEQQQKEEAAKQEAQAKAQTAQMNNLFNESSASVAPTPTNAKVTEKIKLLHPAGILEIYQMWWINEGQSLPLDELEKIHKKMITFCEKKANKDDEHIKSKYIQYVEDVKAK